MTFSSKLCVMLQGRIQYIPQMSHQAPEVWWSRCLSQSKWPSKTQTHTYIHTGSGLQACINMCSHTFQMVRTHTHTHARVRKHASMQEMYLSSVSLAPDIFKCLILMESWNKLRTFSERLYLFFSLPYSINKGQCQIYNILCFSFSFQTCRWYITLYSLPPAPSSNINNLL